MSDIDLLSLEAVLIRAGAGRRTNPGDVANLLVRCLLSDASELLGSWTPGDRERTLAYFGGHCAFTGERLTEANLVWDHLVPHNRNACGLHVYGNLVPATRAANAAKANKDFRTFLRNDRACLGDLPDDEREARVRRLKAFQVESGYTELSAIAAELKALSGEQYERAKAVCQENKALLRERLRYQRDASRAQTNSVTRTVARATAAALPIDYEVEPPSRFLEQFLTVGRAYIEEHYADGRRRLRQWEAQKLTARSNLVSNIRSKPEYRQGAWQAAGLTKLVLRLKP